MKPALMTIYTFPLNKGPLCLGNFQKHDLSHVRWQGEGLYTSSFPFRVKMSLFECLFYTPVTGQLLEGCSEKLRMEA